MLYGETQGSKDLPHTANSSVEFIDENSNVVFTPETVQEVVIETLLDASMRKGVYNVSTSSGRAGFPFTTEGVTFKTQV